MSWDQIDSNREQLEGNIQKRRTARGQRFAPRHGLNLSLQSQAELILHLGVVEPYEPDDMVRARIRLWPNEGGQARDDQKRVAGGPLMSDEKNASLGKAYEANAAQETKQAPPPVQGGAVAMSDSMPETDDVADDARRDRNQHVLPGILGKQLRAAYGELLNSPVPDAIADLIKRLEHAQPGKPATKTPADEEGSK